MCVRCSIFARACIEKNQMSTRPYVCARTLSARKPIIAANISMMSTVKKTFINMISGSEDIAIRQSESASVAANAPFASNENSCARSVIAYVYAPIW